MLVISHSFLVGQYADHFVADHFEALVLHTIDFSQLFSSCFNFNDFCSRIYFLSLASDLNYSPYSICLMLKAYLSDFRSVFLYVYT
jgi:hypothetical protein